MTSPDDAGALTERAGADAVSGAVYENSFRSVRASVGALGIRPHPVRLEATHHGALAHIAEDFLIASRLRRGDVEFGLSIGGYFNETGEVMSSLVDERAPGDETIELPEPVELRMTFDQAVRRRRSARSYTGDPIPLRYLAALLEASCGTTGEVESARLGLRVGLRTAPSGGALYPVQVVVGACRVDGLAPGVYGYDAPRNLLVRRGDARALERTMEAFVGDDEIVTTSNAAAVFLLVARPWRSMRKYGPRGMRHVFLEAGAIAEHLNLAATAIGLGSVDCSSVYDDDVHEALGIDGVFEALVHCVVLGVPA